MQASLIDSRLRHLVSFRSEPFRQLNVIGGCSYKYYVVHWLCLFKKSTGQNTTWCLFWENRCKWVHYNDTKEGKWVFEGAPACDYNPILAFHRSTITIILILAIFIIIITNSPSPRTSTPLSPQLRIHYNPHPHHHHHTAIISVLLNSMSQSCYVPLITWTKS